VFDESGLLGAVAVVTGSTRGIGRASAKRLAQAGAHVVITGRNHDVGSAFATELRQAGHSANYVPLDVCDDDSVKKMAETVVAECGGIDILINNAAALDRLRSGADGYAGSIDMAAVDELLKVNLRGVFLVLREVLPYLVKSSRGGNVINISSLAAMVGHTGFDVYTAAKGALLSLTRSLATEYGPDGVRANCVVVGIIPHTDDRPTHQADSGLSRDVARRVQLIARLGTPEDVANAVAFLASNDQAGFVTGQTLVVDGGLVAKSPTVGL
jgi:3-oxoacyl-[acyl-carrier protein] reductase